MLKHEHKQLQKTQHRGIKRGLRKKKKNSSQNSEVTERQIKTVFLTRISKYEKASFLLVLITI